MPAPSLSPKPKPTKPYQVLALRGCEGADEGACSAETWPHLAPLDPRGSQRHTADARASPGARTCTRTRLTLAALTARGAAPSTVPASDSPLPAAAAPPLPAGTRVLLSALAATAFLPGDVRRGPRCTRCAHATHTPRTCTCHAHATRTPLRTPSHAPCTRHRTRRPTTQSRFEAMLLAQRGEGTAAVELVEVAPARPTRRLGEAASRPSRTRAVRLGRIGSGRRCALRMGRPRSGRGRVLARGAAGAP